jgi:hypothetical protein
MGRYLMRRAGLLFSLTLALTMALSISSAQAKIKWGVVLPTSQLTDAQGNKIDKGGADIVRFGLFWRSIERTNSEPRDFRWNGVDRFMTQLSRTNAKPLPVISGSPAFISNHQFKPPSTKGERNEWKEFLGGLVDRFGPNGDFWDMHPNLNETPMTIYQIWNEENSDKFYRPEPSPSSYGKLLQAASNAIESRFKGAKILLGGMFGDPRSKAAMTAWGFLKKLYRVKGIEKAFDGVAPHAYGQVNDVERTLKKIRKVMRRKGDGQTGVWVTEIGAGSAKSPSPITLGPKGQARFLKKSFGLLKDKKNKWNIKNADWYALYDPRPGPPECPWCESAGLLNSKLQPKPSFDKFKGFAR